MGMTEGGMGMTEGGMGMTEQTDGSDICLCRLKVLFLNHRNSSKSKPKTSKVTILPTKDCLIFDLISSTDEPDTISLNRSE